jgi:hypothetical protein
VVVSGGAGRVQFVLGTAAALFAWAADRSGGLITFGVGSLSEAGQLVAGDPFVREDLLQRRWVKEWAID